MHIFLHTQVEAVERVLRSRNGEGFQRMLVGDGIRKQDAGERESEFQGQRDS